MDDDKQEVHRIHPERGMRVDAGDRLSRGRPARTWKTGHLIAILAILALIAGVFLYTGGEEPAEAPEPQAVAQVEAEPEPELPPAPDIPVVEPEPQPAMAPVEEVEEEAPPLEPEEPALTLEESDDPVREELASAGNSDLLETALVSDNLLERGAGIVDGLSRGLVLTKVLPVSAPVGKFTTVQSGGQTYIDPASYRRYDAYGDAIADLDTAQLVSAFHSFRPLLEEAYAALGHDPADFDNALIRSLDQIIATPVVDGDIAVKRKEAVFQYVDPKLEQLNPLQKQLLRTGPENLAKIKAQATALRKALLAGGG